ncbi:polysaccharide deacetylase family protein [Sandaracinobacter neustonicus]|nr:polysaccharide deacetylase family protein [Sandaracinobacter neustonicus]
MRRIALCMALLLSFLCSPSLAAKSQPQFVLTFDDLPSHGPWPVGETPETVSNRLLAALKAAHIRHAYGFINGASAARDPALAQILKDWTAAGYELRNHGWSHQALDTLDAARFRDELLRNEAFIPAGAPKVFRFPYLDTARDTALRDAARTILAEQGYAVAPDDFGAPDWAYNQAWVRCRAAGDTPALARLEAAFLAQLKDSAARARAAAKTHYGRDIPYVLLLHSSAFTAHMLPQALEMLRAEGFTNTSLSEALADPANAASADPRLPFASASLFTRTGERDAEPPFALDNNCPAR